MSSCSTSCISSVTPATTSRARHYFDVHPPLGKLLYAAEAKLFGISASTLLAGEPAVSLRVLPAILGTLFVPLIYVLCRHLGAARRVALLASFAILCENALLVDVRFSFLESFLICFGLSAIALYLAARTAGGATRWVLLAMSAVMAGSAISVKWTGASALGIILVTWLLDARASTTGVRRTAAEGLLIVGIPIVVYVSVFAVHFHLLRRTGVDDGVMSAQFRATLVGAPAYDPTIRMSLLAKVADVHRAMGRTNYSFEGLTHAASSPWYTWPIMKHPIELWENSDRHSAMIILLGNPVVWWGSGIAVLIAAVMFARQPARMGGGRDRFALAFLLGGFLFNFLPFTAIRRLMFIYHYLFALMFLVALATMSLGALARWNERTMPHSSVSSSRSAYVLQALPRCWPASSICSTSYGWSLSLSARDARFWILHPHF
jgi:dolichyl-phosphate-mannose--protein O-mannosyl transferase